MQRVKGFGELICNFFVPRKNPLPKADFSNVRPSKDTVWAIIPTYKTPKTTQTLVEQIHTYNPDINVLLVDDHTPSENSQNINKLRKKARLKPWLEVIRTPVNSFRAGASNFGLDYLSKLKRQPDYVICMDDDAVIEKDTANILLNTLASRPLTAAVCGNVCVANKNKNLLTRLQGLEYHNFNVSRLMDEGFIYGPLVVHGLMAAFSYKVIQEVGAFTPQHLIEDYDLTAKLKHQGYHVGYASSSIVWTHVPETFGELWRQRVRWHYGGLFVLRNYLKFPLAILPDIIGHLFYIAIFSLVIVSFAIGKNYTIPFVLLITLAITSLINVVISYIFNLYTLNYYKEKDTIDTIIRSLIIFELGYSTLLSLVLLGSYFYYGYTQAVKPALQKLPLSGTIVRVFDRIFKSMGLTAFWGTR
ncbi:glycosyltransferase family 2 protein [Patescibacteria group bacterium]|nr:glycosyltransferase family 2 protein [Patescibacteria group bacterium]MBU1868294.1 glycosyltransferase family 2 protein [Patescibacteria group bacterium]